MNATAWKNTDEHAQWKKLVTKDDTSWIAYMWNVQSRQICKNIRQIRWVVASCWGWGMEWLLMGTGDRISFGEDKNILKLDLAITAQPCEYTKECWISHFARVDYTVCELYLSKTVYRKTH